MVQSSQGHGKVKRWLQDRNEDHDGDLPGSSDLTEEEDQAQGGNGDGGTWRLLKNKQKMEGEEGGKQHSEGEFSMVEALKGESTWGGAGSVEKWI